MTKLIRGVIDPAKKDQDEMFIGWAKAPAIDRRFLLGALPVGLAGTAGASWLIASELDDPGAGSWITNVSHEITGALTLDPYPMIRVSDPSAPHGVRTVLVVAQGKCNTVSELKTQAFLPVKATGALIQRKNRQMLEVSPFAEKWMESVLIDMPGSVAAPEPVSLGSAQLAGTIMDSKCFFGVMRPGRGKTHKACASLCIRGGIPPSFWARTKDGRESVLLMTDAQGGPVPLDILPLVAEAVEAEGELVRVGDLIQFRADVSAYKKI